MATDNTRPEWITKYKQWLTRNELLAVILNGVNNDSKKTTVVNDIGTFVVNSQKLENTLRSIILIVNSYHSLQRLTSNDKSYTVYRKAESLDVPMGSLIKRLANIKLSEGLSKDDLFKKFKNKLESFVKDRNFYIHNMLKNENTKTILQFKTELRAKMLELEELNLDATKFFVLLGDAYNISADHITVMRHQSGVEDRVKITHIATKVKNSKLT